MSLGAVIKKQLEQGGYTAPLIDFSDIKASIGFTEVKSKNLFNPSDANVIIGRYILDGTVNTSANASYNTTGYIPVKAGVSYRLSYKHNIIWLNSSLGLVGSSSLSDTNKTQVCPIGAVYLRCNVSAASWSTFQVEVGTVSTSYEGYYTPILKINQLQLTKSQVIDFKDETLIFLPNEICIAVGRTIEIYNSQAFWAGNVNNYHFLWSGVGKSLQRKWSLTGATGSIGTYTLTLSVFDNNMALVKTATTTVKIVAATITTAFSICPVGDSHSNSKPWYAEVISLASNQISFVGTRGGGTHEGRSGATAGYYQGNNSYTFDTNGITGNDGRTQDLNPFWNPVTNRFDFAYYKSNYNQNPNKVLIWLGTNGINLDATTNVTNIKRFVDGVRATDANMPIFIIFTLFRANQNGIGLQNGVDGYVVNTAWKLEEDRKVFNLQVALYTALAAYTNLYFIPVSLAHDSEFNFLNISTPVNPRASQVEYLTIEATHPQPQGYLQIADIIFSSLAAHQ